MELVKRLISEIQKGEERYEENTSGPGFVRSDDTAHYCRADSCRNVKASKPCSVRCSALKRVCAGLRFANPTYGATGLSITTLFLNADVTFFANQPCILFRIALHSFKTIKYRIPLREFIVADGTLILLNSPLDFFKHSSLCWVASFIIS